MMMSVIIEYWREKIKVFLVWVKPREKDLAIVLIVILTATLSYGLGRLSRIKELREPITIKNAEVATQPEGNLSPAKQGIVASKQGTKYYLPQCYNSTIKPENIITFKTEADAQQAGYSLAAACKN